MSYKFDCLKTNISFVWQLLNSSTCERKRALYYGWLGFKNLGDEALFYCIEEMFKDRLTFNTSGELDRLYFSEKALSSFDVHFIGGGTLINRNETTIDTLLKYRGKIPKAIALGTGVANEEFWQQFEERRDRSNDWRDYLNSCQFVGVRGPDSLRYMQQLGVPKALVTGDPVLYLGRDTIVKKSQRKRIGLNFGNTKNKLWGKSDQHVEDEMAILIRILLEKNWEISFFNVYVDDTKAYYNFVDRNGLNGKIRFFDASDCSMATALDYFDTIDVFVGEKLHASVFAACTYTPFIMLEYRPKCLDFMRSIGYEKYNIRTDKITADEVYNSVEELYQASEGIQIFLKEKVLYHKNLLVSSSKNIIGEVP
ncbi:MAG TPA: hypothetical protein DEP50_07985 [Acinetobacter lwoffii]|nr:hypothetical protein [Acinetobacter lwoffii]